MNKNRQNPSVQYRLDSIQDEDLRSRLEHKYLEFETLRKIQVESFRNAQRNAALATKAMAEMQLAEMDFIIDAGEAFDLISTEPNWITRRTGDGHVVLECLLTQNDIQNIARVQTSQVRNQVENAIGDDADDTDGLFNRDN